MPSYVQSIVAEGLCKSYGGHHAIRDLSFSVNRGEVVGFLGPNGAGKSTTMQILTGLLEATSGEAYVAGYAVARNPAAVKRAIGYMPENNPLPEEMRVREYLRHRARLKGLDRRTTRSRVEEVLDLCDLQRKAARKLIRSLSKGFRQRVGIADAIIGRPEVTILDEPTIGLDPHQVLVMRRLVERIREHTTILLSSHILAEVEISCDRVLILSQGRLVAAGTPTELRREFIRNHRYIAEVRGESAALRREVAAVHAELAVTRVGEPDEDGFYSAEIECPLAEDFAEPLLQRLHACPALRLRALARRQPSLEDIFLAATKRSWELEMNGSVTQTAQSGSAA
ncbi:MAG: ABC transporter ATP-binding protein [Opitutales bacterium]|nr:ABC transporter ATP-binding protein [Opitutales bacterium]